MIKCPQCGAENFPGMAYCEQCGTALPTPEASAAPAPASVPAAAGDGAAADAIAGAQALLDQLGDDASNAAPSAQEATHTVSAPAAAAEAAPADAPAAPAPAVAASAPADIATPAPDAPPAPAVPDQAAAGFPQAATPLPAPMLTITFADNAEFSVKQDVTNVGRADIAQDWHPELDVIPFGGGDPNFGVSRHQAVIRRDGNTFSILDVGSTNGTYVNGRMLEYNKAVELRDGDTIAFGAFNAKIRIGA